MMNVIIHQMQFQMLNFQMLYLLAILFLSLKKNHRFHHAYQSFFSLEEGSTVSFAQNRRTSACV